MRRSLALLALAAPPSVAFASDPAGLLPVLFLQVVLLTWPLILPLFYLGPRHNKLHAYFLFAVLTYGSVGIAGLPESFYTIVSSWFPDDGGSYSWLVPAAVAKHAIALVFCLWYLPRFRALLREPQAGPQHA